MNAFYIGTWNEGKSYQRTIYSVLDCLGNIGGLSDAVGKLCGFANFLFTGYLLKVYMAEVYDEMVGEEKTYGCCFKFQTLFGCLCCCDQGFEQEFREIDDKVEKLENLTNIN